MYKKFELFRINTDLVHSRSIHMNHDLNSTNASALSTGELASFIKADTYHISPRLFAMMAKAKNHKLNNFQMFPQEGKIDNPVNPQNTEKVTKVAT